MDLRNMGNVPSVPGFPPEVVEAEFGLAFFAAELVVQNDKRSVASYLKRVSSY